MKSTEIETDETVWNLNCRDSSPDSEVEPRPLRRTVSDGDLAVRVSPYRCTDV